MDWVWWTSYLGAGLLAWIFLLRKRRKLVNWQDEDGCLLVLAAVVAPELLMAFLGCMMFWPILVPYVLVRTKGMKPVSLTGMEADPTRSPELVESRGTRSNLHGKTGVAATEMNPGGMIALEGEEYDAVLRHGSAEAGDLVKVIGSDDLRLEVIAVPGE